MVPIKKNNEIMLFSNKEDLFHYAAKDFSLRAVRAVNSKGIFSVVLSGGNTPVLFYDILTQYHNENIPWDKIQFFFGDERYVPSTDENSNYHIAYEHLFSKVPINPENIYRIPTEFNDPNDAARSYENTLKKVFHISDDACPPFDLLYLGLGENAHTASLMPFSDVLKQDAEKKLVASLFVSELNMYRITLTPYAINHGLDIIFLVTGKDKSSAVKAVLEGKEDPLQYPAQLIQSVRGKTIWYLDCFAAQQL